MSPMAPTSRFAFALACCALVSGCAEDAWQGPCRANADCLFSGNDVGKVCNHGICEFADENTAPNFCLPVINPSSTYYGQNRCLAEEKGQVVLIFFGLLA
jgi:hypothetical protein